MIKGHKYLFLGEKISFVAQVDCVYWNNNAVPITVDVCDCWMVSTQQCASILRASSTRELQTRTYIGCATLRLAKFVATIPLEDIDLSEEETEQ